ncbi:MULTISPECIES: 2-succinyl-5-enolpyruvyl-6-hydroxy-3-cyclohexene-1-carboxylic-acid synthase [Haloferax]|uniref:2-succinyl-5-enolpyruvyl-6-hydroxy-3-cyclohexene-1-carboxylate synthase n=1 Tax=Haloferax marinum TaxID=2666143 RepID=A0A6A8G4L4_9EURY|nr:MULTISPECIES: 2-succinyl-5-enolpyruvyl-6-hydroxy-3-cyclohexene-1-carboxylic-acid synthase [Haloferax]KAB1196313.1 2-succinyl-5-enolpyruvyl-6-hydroxy-3-cyclohexene-1-carboxylic-acid synthase [Haloferax sp. CBA1150]MRW95303.1 2-succinyl-5-enolpyruvyl-6-hydroxy-3-cyclohexene-1-carboxylic-acid synthase [Haloferax marinum]
MTHPNRNTLWARTFVDELARSGINAVCIAPGSRSTPLTEAFDRHDDVETFSHLDERSMAYFALGRARRTGKVTPIVCTSGTAAANFHPAVIEASQGRVPMLVLTADRPPEIRDSGANQTIDQEKLYGSAVRWYKDMPEPEATDRKLRSLRTTAARAVSEATGVDAGPVHLNFPFRKPLEPTYVEGDVPADIDPEARDGRDGNTPYVRTTDGVPELPEDHLRNLADELSVGRGLIVAGPADPPGFNTEAIAAFAHATGFPIVADPLSGLRFGGHTRTTTVLGGYDGYLDERITDDWPDPDVVVRIGASPTSKPLRKYLARTDARQYVVDPSGEWREAEFTATDLVEAEPSVLAWRLSQLVRNRPDAEWNQLWTDAEDAHWDAVDAETDAFEGRLAADVADLAPEPSTLFVSNSMPVRELDRFGRPSAKSRTVLGNRGASGIDGIVSSALGAGSASTDHLTLLTGDLAYYHDMNGLLALGRLGVDATIVLVNNDGGGIFHMLPIEEYEPPFTEQFKTPHGLDFSATEGLYDLSFSSVEMDEFRDAYADSVASDGTDVIEVRTDAASSHRVRDEVRERVVDQLTD